jgi:hypothetical protein
MAAVLQQRVDNVWQPLAFFSRNLNPAQQKYSAYDREQLAVYEAVKYFRHMLEAHHFAIFTDHKPLIYAFQQKRDKCSPRQFNHLDFVAQFTTDVRHISGQDNVVADALSRVESFTVAPSQTHWPHRRRTTANFEHSWRQTRHYGLRSSKFPAQQSPYTATRLQGNLGRTSQVPYGSKCSSPSTICLTQAQMQQHGW